MNKYLKDKIFLSAVDNMTEKEQYIKITVLDSDENEIDEIQGYVTNGGTLSINGDSAVRRTCTLNMIADKKYSNIMETTNLLSINKRIKIEIGLANKTIYYPEEEIIWFPLGIFIIINPNISRSTSGISISLSLQDKMCLLNGSRGGVIPAYVTFDTVDEITPSGTIETKKIPIYQIIQELVNHFGNIPLDKIIIKDVDTVAKEVLRWNNPSKQLCVNYSTKKVEVMNEGAAVDSLIYPVVFHSGDDIGYHYTDFYYDDDLTANIGDNVCTILDKIKNKIGNYEYFFDIEGYFHFQEKKNYYNTSKATNINNIEYITNSALWQSEYDFNNDNLIVSYQNTPQYDMIKNDFLIWGKRKSADNKDIPIRYHLCLDKKPKPRSTCTFVKWIYNEPIQNGTEILYNSQTLIKPPIEVLNHKSRPSPGYPGMIYHSIEEDDYSYWTGGQETGTYQIVGSYTENEEYYYNAWLSTKSKIESTTPKEKQEKALKDALEKLKKSCPNLEEVIARKSNNFQIYKDVKIKDWRTELYIQGCLSERYATDNNYYYAELINEWPKVYDIIKGRFKEKSIEQSADIDYFLDFIERGSTYNSISISNVGRLSKVVSDDKINCIFEPIIEDYVFCYSANEVKWCQTRGQQYLDVSTKSDLIENNTILGGTLNSAYNLMKDLIYEYTNYNESITLQCLPIYHLEPNTIITVEDTESLISGEYVINNLSIPMDLGGTMSITAKRVAQRR